MTPRRCRALPIFGCGAHCTMGVLPLSASGLHDELPGYRAAFGQHEPMPLDGGGRLGPFTVAYQNYGRLDAARANAILVCHALTGDQFVAETHPVTGKPG